MFAAKVARFVIFVEFFYLVEREMGELCVAAGQVQSGGSHSQPALSSSAPATDLRALRSEVQTEVLRRRERVLLLGPTQRADC